jgi:hypothetical protein
MLEMVDGTISIMTSTDDNVNPAEKVSQWSEPDRSSVLSITEITPGDIPVRDKYRNAYEKQGDVPGVNMEKAKEVHRELLRRERAPKLAALDVELSKAFKDPVKQDEIEAKRQALRDVTTDPSIAAATTLEELKLAIPNVLKD